MNRSYNILFVFLTAFLFTQCYSFKNTSIPPEIETFYIKQFSNKALNVPPAFSTNFTEELKDKIRTSSRLIYQDTDPHIEFVGSINSYKVTSEAPTGNQTVSFNRLEIIVGVEYINRVNEKDKWNKTFRHFADFAPDQNLIDVEEALTTDISERLIEDIFNQAFTNW